VIDGNERMRDRPLGSLTDALPMLGMTVEHLGRVGYPPVRLHPALSGPPPEAMIELGKTASSQFISALLLCGPWLASGLTMTLNETITSRSYIEMTVGLLDRLGASVRLAEDLRVIRVGPCEHRADRGRIGIDPFDYAVEPDASGATYFWAAAGLITGARCRVRGIGRDSLQGDADFPEILARMGITLLEHTDDDGTFETRGPRSLTGVLADMSDMPDAVMTLAVCCAFATTPSVIRGVRTLRVKETDRIAALQAELAKIDVKIEVAADSDTITVTPPPNGVECSGRAMPVEFETYDDHRMAMSLALIGLRRPNVCIRNPGCVAKTYPGYWRDLGKLYEAE
jgi:3-phosphoshikimate 1-carboxyvinyltransferase